MTQQNAVLGRFAPSPSGRMHLGNAFSALLAWLSARAAGGQIVLRIEDLDRQRCSPEKAAQIREDLRWLGLDWDWETTPQSQRDEAYEAALARLQALDAVFPCWCSRGQLHAASAPHASDGAWLYPGTCRDLTPAQRAEKTGTPSWRLRVPAETIGFTDGVYGERRQELAAECGDFVLRKADGTFAYQLAVVVDDLAAGVTQVVRGRDLLDSTPRQLYLIRLLGGTAPEYYHVPMLLSPDGRRLSKRDQDLDLGRLRETLAPAEITGRLAYLAGLLPRPEAVSPAELAGEFAWEKVRRADIPFDTAAFLSGQLEEESSCYPGESMI